MAIITSNALLTYIALPFSNLKSILFETPINMDIPNSITDVLNKLKYLIKKLDNKGTCIKLSKQVNTVITNKE